MDVMSLASTFACDLSLASTFASDLDYLTADHDAGDE